MLYLQEINNYRSFFIIENKSISLLTVEQLECEGGRKRYKKLNLKNEYISTYSLLPYDKQFDYL